MNDDFLKQFRQNPPPEFAENLYKRISKPMTNNNNTYRVALGRMAWAMAAVSLLAAFTLAVSPPARAWAGELLRQIGPFRLIDASDPSRVGVPADAAALPTAEPPAETEDVMTAHNAAEAGTLAGFEVFTPVELFGYEMDGDWFVSPNGNGTAVISSYRHPESEHFLTLNQYEYGPGDQFDQSYGQNEKVIDVMVNGVKAIAVSGRYMTHPDAPANSTSPELLETNWLFWEVDGVVYTLFGDALSINELIEIAESMR